MFEHRGELSGELHVLIGELLDDLVERGLSTPQCWEQVVVFGLVMFVKERRVCVKRLKKFAKTLLVRTDRDHESHAILVIRTELVVRRLQRDDERALACQVAEESEGWVRTFPRRARSVVRAAVHAEEQRLGATVVATDPRSDFWYWDYVFAADPTASSTARPA